MFGAYRICLTVFSTRTWNEGRLYRQSLRLLRTDPSLLSAAHYIYIILYSTPWQDGGPTDTRPNGLLAKRFSKRQFNCISQRRLLNLLLIVKMCTKILCMFIYRFYNSFLEITHLWKLNNIICLI